MKTRAWGRSTVAILLVSHLAFAADPLPPPPPPPPPPPIAPGPAECYPACRAGYFCSAGQCVSACNPPCAAGEVCSSTGQCVPGAEVTAPEPRRDGEGPPPPGYHYESRRRIGMLIGGLVPLAIGYGLSILYGAYMLTSNDTGWYHGSYNLFYFVPIVGPLLRQFAVIGSTNISSTYITNGFLPDMLVTVIFTAAEVVGFIFTLLGATRTTQVLVRDDGTASVEVDQGPRWTLAPLISPYGGGGVSLLLRY